MILLIIFPQVKVGYFSYVGIWFELLGVLAIFAISTFKILDNKFFNDLSSVSFTVYLIHMMAIGVLDRIYNLHYVIQPFSTAIVIGACYVGIIALRWFAKLIKIDKVVYPLFGFRKSKNKGE